MNRPHDYGWCGNGRAELVGACQYDMTESMVKADYFDSLLSSQAFKPYRLTQALETLPVVRVSKDQLATVQPGCRAPALVSLALLFP